VHPSSMSAGLADFWWFGDLVHARPMRVSVCGRVVCVMCVISFLFDRKILHRSCVYHVVVGAHVDTDSRPCIAIAAAGYAWIPGGVHVLSMI
jgi:hypothetical protein